MFSCFYVFMFLCLGLFVGFPGFLKHMCLYIEAPKTNIDIFSHILNFISLKRGFSFFLAWASGFYQRLISLWRIFTWLTNLLDCGVLHPCLILRSSLIYFCCPSRRFKFRNDCPLSWIGSYHLVSRVRFWFEFPLLSYFSII